MPWKDTVNARIPVGGQLPNYKSMAQEGNMDYEDNQDHGTEDGAQTGNLDYEENQDHGYGPAN